MGIETIFIFHSLLCCKQTKITVYFEFSWTPFDILMTKIYIFTANCFSFFFLRKLTFGNFYHVRAPHPTTTTLPHVFLSISFYLLCTLCRNDFHFCWINEVLLNWEKAKGVCANTHTHQLAHSTVAIFKSGSKFTFAHVDSVKLGHFISVSQHKQFSVQKQISGNVHKDKES